MASAAPHRGSPQHLPVAQGVQSPMVGSSQVLKLDCLFVNTKKKHRGPKFTGRLCSVAREQSLCRWSTFCKPPERPMGAFQPLGEGLPCLGLAAFCCTALHTAPGKKKPPQWAALLRSGGGQGIGNVPPSAIRCNVRPGTHRWPRPCPAAMQWTQLQW